MKLKLKDYWTISSEKHKSDSSRTKYFKEGNNLNHNDGRLKKGQRAPDSQSSLHSTKVWYTFI